MTNKTKKAYEADVKKRALAEGLTVEMRKSLDAMEEKLNGAINLMFSKSG